MYKVKVGDLWVSKVSMLTPAKYTIELTVGRTLAGELDDDEVKCVLKNFSDAKIIKINISELDVTDIVKERWKFQRDW